MVRIIIHISKKVTVLHSGEYPFTRVLIIIKNAQEQVVGLIVFYTFNFVIII